MKKKLFLLTMLSTNILARNNDNETAPLELMILMNQQAYSAYHEGYYRTLLYKWYKDNPCFSKMRYVQKNKEYFIAIIKKHIEKLEDKLQKKPNSLFSKSMLKGSLGLVFAAISATAFSWFYKRKVYSHSPAAYQWEDDRSQALVSSGVSTLGCSAFAAWYFYKIARYAERVKERLERDKAILKLLEEE